MYWFIHADACPGPDLALSLDIFSANLQKYFFSDLIYLKISLSSSMLKPRYKWVWQMRLQMSWWYSVHDQPPTAVCQHTVYLAVQQIEPLGYIFDVGVSLIRQGLSLCGISDTEEPSLNLTYSKVLLWQSVFSKILTIIIQIISMKTP